MGGFLNVAHQLTHYPKTKQNKRSKFVIIYFPIIIYSYLSESAG
jgi:hypothetical protein